MAYKPLNWKKNNWDLDCCQKDRHSRTLLRRQNATKKTHTYHHCTPQYLKTQPWYIRTCRVPKPLASSTKEASQWCTSWQWHNQNLSKVFKRQVKSYRIESSKETTSFLLFTPRLAWIVPKFNTTSKRARTGGASYIDKNKQKSYQRDFCEKEIHLETLQFCTLHLCKQIWLFFIEQKSLKKRNYTNTLSRVYRCASQSHR